MISNWKQLQARLSAFLTVLERHVAIPHSIEKQIESATDLKEEEKKDSMEKISTVREYIDKEVLSEDVTDVSEESFSLFFGRSVRNRSSESSKKEGGRSRKWGMGRMSQL